MLLPLFLVLVLLPSTVVVSPVIVSPTPRTPLDGRSRFVRVAVDAPEALLLLSRPPHRLPPPRLLETMSETLTATRFLKAVVAEVMAARHQVLAASARPKLPVRASAAVGRKAAVAAAVAKAQQFPGVVLATAMTTSLPLSSRRQLVDGALGMPGKAGLTLALLLSPSPSPTPCTYNQYTTPIPFSWRQKTWNSGNFKGIFNVGRERAINRYFTPVITSRTHGVLYIYDQQQKNGVRRISQTPFIVAIFRACTLETSKWLCPLHVFARARTVEKAPIGACRATCM